MSSIDGAAFVVGTVVIFILATMGAIVAGVLAVLGTLTLRNQLEKVEAADALIEQELERTKLERMAQRD